MAGQVEGLIASRQAVAQRLSRPWRKEGIADNGIRMGSVFPGNKITEGRFETVSVRQGKRRWYAASENRVQSIHPCWHGKGFEMRPLIAFTAPFLKLGKCYR